MISEPSYADILRYLGVKDPDEKMLNLINELLPEAQKSILPRLCYSEFEISVSPSEVLFPFVKVPSYDLAKALLGCKRAIIFGATLGLSFDRLLQKYSHLSPSRAVVLQAIGAERIENLCDNFCESLKEKYKITPRFSAGYGDLSLSFQEAIFSALNCSKKIGLSLNQSMLMSPSKSVTAIVGIKSEE